MKNNKPENDYYKQLDRFMILINQLNADLEQVHGISEEDRSSIQGVIDELSRVVLETFK